MTDAQDILRHLASSSGVTVQAIRYGRRTQPLVWIRHVAAWLIRNLAGASFPMTGLAMGGHDHSTMINSCRRVECDIQCDGPRLRILLDFIEYTRTRAS